MVFVVSLFKCSNKGFDCRIEAANSRIFKQKFSCSSLKFPGEIREIKRKKIWNFCDNAAAPEYNCKRK